MCLILAKSLKTHRQKGSIQGYLHTLSCKQVREKLQRLFGQIHSHLHKSWNVSMYADDFLAKLLCIEGWLWWASEHTPYGLMSSFPSQVYTGNPPYRNVLYNQTGIFSKHWLYLKVRHNSYFIGKQMYIKQSLICYLPACKGDNLTRKAKNAPQNVHSLFYGFRVCIYFNLQPINWF